MIMYSTVCFDVGELLPHQKSLDLYPVAKFMVDMYCYKR